MLVLFIAAFKYQIDVFFTLTWSQTDLRPFPRSDRQEQLNQFAWLYPEGWAAPWDPLGIFQRNALFFKGPVTSATSIFTVIFWDVIFVSSFFNTGPQDDYREVFHGAVCGLNVLPCPAMACIAQVPCQLNQVATFRAMCHTLATEPLVAAKVMI